MSNDPSSKSTMVCPICLHSFPGPKNASAKRVECPNCRTSIAVPETLRNQEDPEAWLGLDEPTTPAKGETASRPAPRVFDDDLPELAPLTAPALQSSAEIVAAHESASNLDRALEQLSRKDGTPSDFSNKPGEEEFSFPCKVCGTLLYASVSRIGSMTRCPDCHSEFSIPSRPTKKTQLPNVVIDETIANVRLAPVDTPSPREEKADSSKTKEILDKAAIEVEREQREIQSVAVPFDTQRWLSMILGCFRDPGVIFLAVVLGLFAAACFYALHRVGRMEMPLIQIWLVRFVLFALFGVPILVSILMCCMVIIPMAANRKDRVEDWPFGRFGDAIGEIGMVCSALVMAALPGCFLATLLSWGDIHEIVRDIVVLASIGLLTPILLLSMIDNNRITQPFSRTIFESIGARPDAWGGMYFQSAIVLAGLFVLYSIAYMTSPTTSAILGAVLPACLFFISNLYGILAGRISDITHLGFTGDFSQDQET